CGIAGNGAVESEERAAPGLSAQAPRRALLEYVDNRIASFSDYRPGRSLSQPPPPRMAALFQDEWINNPRPVISSGFAIPSISSIVGAMSSMEPPSRRAPSNSG